MINNTSWAKVAISPERWGEAARYATQIRPKGFAAFNFIDPRDIDAGIPLGSVNANIPNVISLREKAEAIGWEPKKQGHNMCTAFSKGNGVEITNTILNQKPCYIDMYKQWNYQLANGASNEDGDFVQNAEAQFHKNPQGFPQTEYARLRRDADSIFGVSRWLLDMETIRTGVYWRYIPELRKTNWQHYVDTGEYIAGSGRAMSGHACNIVGKNDHRQNPDGSVGALELIESEMVKSNGNKAGQMWVPYNQFPSLFSKYVSRDARDDI